MTGKQQTDVLVNFSEGPVTAENNTPAPQTIPKTNQEQQAPKSQTKPTTGVTVNSNLDPNLKNKVLAENEDLVDVSNIPDFKHALSAMNHENV
jgi:hypothetical protein